ncbi:MAG TPA: hypothetical protein VKS60_06965, partial [Stellaceae bacterium]|nr:hypothetical protein [Stellaceae bacterium]
WESSFEGRAVVRVGRSAAGIAASWSRSDSLFAPEELGVQANISGDAWKRLRRAVDDLGLWGLTREGEYFGLDGATLQVEGRRGMVYRSIKRCSPRGPLWFVGRLLCDIAGPPLSTLDL